MRETAFAVLAIAALTGCSPPAYDHLVLAFSGAGSTEVQLSPLALPEGVVVVLTATPMSSDGPLGGDFTFDLTSSNVGVVGVEPALGGPTDRAEFVFFGVGPGEASVLVTVNDEAEAPIPATVLAQ
jgi:hypothetical protein